MITRTNGSGIYKLPGFGKEVTPNNIVISCSKEGYKHIRTSPGARPARRLYRRSKSFAQCSGSRSERTGAARLEEARPRFLAISSAIASSSGLAQQRS